MATEQYTFQGWMGLDKESAKGNMVWQEFPKDTIKPFDEADVDIQVSHAGICGSDLHTLSAGWGPTAYPCCVGHEIVGKAVRVGSKVEKGIKVGDRVGVGAQNASCQNQKGDCEECQNGLENHCMNATNTFADKYPGGGTSYGGYSDYHRATSHFVFKIPEKIASEDAAPMLCGGITLYSPLKDNGCGPGKKVGIIGVGGLGHFGVLFAKALGADKVVGISRKAEKKADVLKLGADEYISTDEDPDWAQHHARSLDLIVCTVSNSKMPLMDYLSLLKVKGTFVQVGAPEDKLPDLTAFAFIAKGVTLKGSMIGPPAQIEEMLDFVVEKDIKPMIELFPMEKANDAIKRFNTGQMRYRITLVNEKHT
ncbi:hypothetical protein B0A48_01232 [Cryoendolithus antarcticus]|uniref:alcohol dehydrogenase (NADP(+)) n=1 Tax=Cryoendolithus antarcticus TaxID=1507870 RepID=A0A1V8TSM1_9PEZI|nr:hypothetical protein B0A48_01232 [Cryoendolithus antarcticus]